MQIKHVYIKYLLYVSNEATLKYKFFNIIFKGKLFTDLHFGIERILASIGNQVYVT